LRKQKKSEKEQRNEEVRKGQKGIEEEKKT
jgi:hypothetical protein